jgi:capsular polysaccharide biosynthesis protein
VNTKNVEDQQQPMKDMLGIMNEKVTKMAQSVERVQIADYVQLLNRPRRLIWINLLAGIFRGIGIALGFTVFATTIVYVLQFIGALDLPIVGGYIAEIVKHVQFQLQRDGY